MSLFTTDIKQDPISKLNLHFYTELCKHNNSTSRADNPVKLNVRQMYNTRLNINKKINHTDNGSKSVDCVI